MDDYFSLDIDLIYPNKKPLGSTNYTFSANPQEIRNYNTTTAHSTPQTLPGSSYASDNYLTDIAKFLHVSINTAKAIGQVGIAGLQLGGRELNERSAFKDSQFGQQEIWYPETTQLIADSLKVGLVDLKSRVQTYDAQFYRLLGADQLHKKFSELSKGSQERADELRDMGLEVAEPEKFWDGAMDRNWIARGVGENSISLLATFGARAVAGPPGLILSAFVQEFGGAMQDAQSFGLSDEEAMRGATFVGVANTFLEYLNINKLFKAVPWGKQLKDQIMGRVSKAIFGQMLSEGTTESLQEMVLNSVAQSYDEDRNIWDGVPESFFFGTLVGGGASAGMVVLNEAGSTGMALGIEDVSTAEDRLNQLDEIAKNRILNAEEMSERQQLQRAVAERTNLPLLREARNYNTFNEFLEAQKTYYIGEGSQVRGIPAGLENVGDPGQPHKATLNVLGDSVYITEEKETAEKYGKVSEVYANLSNPLVLDNTNGDYDGDITLVKLMQKAKIKSPLDPMVQMKGGAEVSKAVEMLKKAIQAQGYDGVVVKLKKGQSGVLADMFEDSQVVVFDKTAVVSKPQMKATYDAANAGVSAETRRDKNKVTAQVREEMDYAEAGSRESYWDEAQNKRVFVANKSTFPNWVPEHLKERKLFNKVWEKRDAGKLPVGKRQVELNNVIDEEIASRRDLGLADAEALEQFIAEQNSVDEQLKQLEEYERAKRSDDPGPEFYEEMLLLKNNLEELKTAIREHQAQPIMNLVNKHGDIIDPLFPGMTLDEMVEPFFESLTEAQVAVEDLLFLKKEYTALLKKLQTKEYSPLQLANLTTRVKVRAELHGYEVAKQVVSLTFQNRMADESSWQKAAAFYVRKYVDTTKQFKYKIENVKDENGYRDIVRRAAPEAERVRNKKLRTEIIDTYNTILRSKLIPLSFKEKAKAITPFDGSKKTIAEAYQALKGGDLIPKRLLNVIEKFQQRPMNKLTNGELQQILTILDEIEVLGRQQFKDKTKMEDVAHEDRLKAILPGTVTFHNNHFLKPDLDGTRTISERIKDFYQASIANRAVNFHTAINSANINFDIMDGGHGYYNGPNYMHIKQPVDFAFANYLTTSDNWARPIRNVISKLYKIEGKNLTVEKWRRWEVERRRSMNKVGVVGIREQRGGEAKLLNLWLTPEDQENQQKVDEALKEIRAIKLNKKEAEVLRVIRQQFAVIFPEAARVAGEVWNQKVHEQELYFSFMTDFKKSSELEIQQRFDIDLAQIAAKKSKVPKADELKSRVGAGGQMVRIDAYQVAMKYIDDMAYYVEMSQTLKDVERVIRDPRWQRKVGDVMALFADDWFQAVRRNGGSESGMTFQPLDTARTHVTSAILGAKLSTVLIQPSAVADGGVFLGAQYIKQGTNEFFTNKEAREFLIYFAELKARIGGEAAVAELIDESFIAEIRQAAFAPMKFTDSMTASIVVLGAYKQHMDKLGLEIDYSRPPNKEAMAWATLVLQNTQASTFVKDLPTFVTRGRGMYGNISIAKTLATFQTFIMKRYGTLSHDIIRAGIRNNDLKGSVRKFAWLAAANGISAGVRVAIVAPIIRALTGEEPEKSLSDEFWKSYVFEGVTTVPFIGNVFSSYFYGSSPLPIFDMWDKMVGGLRSANNAKSPEARFRGHVKFWTSLAGLFYGLPGVLQTQQLLNKKSLADQNGTRASVVNSDNFNLEDGLDLDIDLDLDLDLDLDIDL